MPSPGPSATVTVRPQSPFSPNCLHMPSAGSTLQLFASALDSKGLVVSTTFTWSSDNASVATVNSSSGLVTGVANGICNITAQANDSGAAKNSIAVGVALLSPTSVTIANGQNTTISSVGGFSTVNWCSGASGAGQVYAGTLDANGQISNPTDPRLGWGAGSVATVITGIYHGPTGSSATAHVPVFANVGGIYCMATVNVTGVPNWVGN